MGTVGLKALGQRREIGNEQMDLNLDSLLCYGIRSREGTPVPNLASNMTNHRITAEEALAKADYESKVDFIDEQIEEAANRGERLIRLEIDSMIKQKLIESLTERGFNTYEQKNSTMTEVSW